MRIGVGQKLGMLVMSVALMSATALDETSVFTDAPLHEAAQQAVEEQRLLIIDATASWCAPCQRMDAQTWAHGGVRAWIEANAIAVQLDVDRSASRAWQLGLHSLPTVLVLRGDEEIGRHTGYQGPVEFLAWVEGIRSTEPQRGPRHPKLLVEMEESTAPTPRARSEQAQEHLRAGRLDEALADYSWVWNESLAVDPAYRGVRRSYLASDIAAFVRRYPPAAVAFTSYRDLVAQRLRETPGSEQEWEDYCVLTRTILEEPEQLLEFYEELQASNQGALALPSLAVNAIFEEFYERGDLKAAAAVVTDPEARGNAVFERMRRNLDALAQFHDKSMTSLLRASSARAAAQLHVATLAAGQEDLARRLAALARKEVGDEIALTAIIEEARSHDLVHPMHREWLEGTLDYWVALAPLRAELREVLPSELPIAEDISTREGMPSNPSVEELRQSVLTLGEVSLFGGLGARLRLSRWGDDALPAFQVLLADSFAERSDNELTTALELCGTKACADLLVEILAGRTPASPRVVEFQLTDLVKDEGIRSAFAEHPEFKSLVWKDGVDGDTFDQRRFTKVAAAMGWVDAEPLLRLMLEHPHRELREDAAQALESLLGDSAAELEKELSPAGFPRRRLLDGLLAEPLAVVLTAAEPVKLSRSEEASTIQVGAASFTRDFSGQPRMALSVANSMRFVDSALNVSAATPLERYSNGLLAWSDGEGEVLAMISLTGLTPTQLMGPPTRDMITGFGLVDDEGSELWHWERSKRLFPHVALVYDSDGGVDGVAVAAGDSLMRIALNGSSVWESSPNTFANRVRTHPELPQRLVTLFGDFDIFEVGDDDFRRIDANLNAPFYASTFELFPDAAGQPTLLAVGRGDHGGSSICRMDLQGVVAWKATLPSYVSDLAMLEPVGADGVRLFVAAQRGGELFVFDDEGTLLTETALPGPIGEAVNPVIDVEVGALGDDVFGVYANGSGFPQLYLLDLSLLRE